MLYPLSYEGWWVSQYATSPWRWRRCEDAERTASETEGSLP